MTSLRAWFVCAAFLAGCGDADDDNSAPTLPPAPDPAEETTTPTPGPEPEPSDLDAGASMFVDVTDEVGLAFEFRGRPGDSYHFPGITGGGAAVFDANGDGRLDIYFLNGNDGTPESTLRNRLFLQRDDGTFVDGTDGSGLGDRAYAMGCAVGDIDNDGDLDVYVTNYGPDRLFRNDGDGVFTDISDSAGISNAGWSASAAFLDFDRDGWLDVYVANYVHYDEDKACTSQQGRPEFCGPDAFPSVADCLYRNRGDGTFVDVTEAAGIASAAHAGLGVVCADLDDDGWIDIYVANDGDPNLLWMNQRDGTFIDDAIILGVAYNNHGMAEAGMGVTAGDADGDGDLDLFVAHLRDETNTYYRNDGGISFGDVTTSVGLGAVSAPYTGFGTTFFDADLDGDLDLAVVNGAVKRLPSPLRDDIGFWNDYAEPNLMFRNDGRGRFELAADLAGTFAVEIEVSRGLIPVDIDADGDQDLLVTNIAGPARLYRNQCRARSWLAITVHDPDLNREALGAKVVIRTDVGRFVRHAIPPGGFMTDAPATIHLGLPADATVVAIDVRWPDGLEESFAGEVSGRIELRRGSGVTVP